VCARPQRYFELTLTDDLLARADLELIVAVGAYLAEDLSPTRFGRQARRAEG